MNDDRFINWRKSTRSSGATGNCVEVGIATGHTVGVRDTKQHGRGPVLGVLPHAWAIFLADIKDGEFGQTPR